MSNYYKLLPSSYNNKTFICLKELKNATKYKDIVELEKENKEKWKKRMVNILTQNEGYFISVSLYTNEAVVSFQNNINYELTTYIIYNYFNETDTYGSDVDLETINITAFYEIIAEIMEEEQKSYIITKFPNTNIHNLDTINVAVVQDLTSNKRQETTILEIIQNSIRNTFYRKV
jgi:hypothetical protein